MAATGEGGGGAGGRLRERGVGGEEGIERERPGERAGLGIIKDGWPQVEVGPLVNLPCVAGLHTAKICLPCVLRTTHGKLFLCRVF